MTPVIPSRWRLRRRGLVLSASLLVLFGTGGAAATAPESTPITLGWALQQTLQHSPQLKTYPYRLRLSDGAILQAGQRPRPTLGLELENIAGSGELSGTDSAELTLTLGQTLELGGKRRSRLALADARKQRRQVDYEQTRLALLVETSRRYYQLLQAQLLQDWIEGRIRSERQALAVVEARAGAGAAGNADVSKVQLRLARSRAQAGKLAAAALQARAYLAAMWADTPRFIEASGDLMQLPSLPNHAQFTQVLSEALDQAPQLLNQQALLRIAQAQAQLARANSRNDLRWGVGLRHREASSDQALLLSLSMPVGNPGRGKLAMAEAGVALSEEETAQVKRQLQVSLFAMQQQLAGERDYAHTIASSLLPQARQLLADTEAGYSRGRYSVLQWLDAQAERFELERELIDSHTRVYWQLLELERLTGQSLISPTVKPQAAENSSAHTTTNTTNSDTHQNASTQLPFLSVEGI